MHLYTLTRAMDVPTPLAKVFAFFEKAENLERLTPSTLGFQILTPLPIAMHPGTVIDYVIRVSGLPMHWRTLITDYDPPRGFVDVQLKGPYSIWHHTHRFAAIPGGTCLIDEVRYALPFGPLGRLAHALFVGRQLRRIFDFRAEVIRGLFGEIGAAGQSGDGEPHD